MVRYVVWFDDRIIRAASIAVAAMLVLCSVGAVASLLLLSDSKPAIMLTVLSLMFAIVLLLAREQAKRARGFREVLQHVKISGTVLEAPPDHVVEVGEVYVVRGGRRERVVFTPVKRVGNVVNLEELPACYCIASTKVLNSYMYSLEAPAVAVTKGGAKAIFAVLKPHTAAPSERMIELVHGPDTAAIYVEEEGGELKIRTYYSKQNSKKLIIEVLYPHLLYKMQKLAEYSESGTYMLTWRPNTVKELTVIALPPTVAVIPRKPMEPAPEDGIQGVKNTRVKALLITGIRAASKEIELKCVSASHNA